jgi:hypothetical protein
MPTKQQAQQAIAQARREQRYAELEAQKQHDQARQAELDQALQEQEQRQRAMIARRGRVDSGQEDVPAAAALDQAFAAMGADRAAFDRKQRRELEASPEHQRLLAGLSESLPPQAQQERKKEYFASQPRELSLDESYSALQVAKATVGLSVRS